MSTKKRPANRFTIEKVDAPLRRMLFALAAEYECSKGEIFRRGVQEMHRKYIGERRRDEVEA